MTVVLDLQCDHQSRRRHRSVGRMRRPVPQRFRRGRQRRSKYYPRPVDRPGGSHAYYILIESMSEKQEEQNCFQTEQGTAIANTKQKKHSCDDLSAAIVNHRKK